MELANIDEWFAGIVDKTLELFSSPAFFSQLGLIVLALVVALTLALLLRRRSRLFRQPPEGGPLFGLRRTLYRLGDQLFALFTILALTVTVELSEQLVRQSWLIRIAESLAVVYMLYTVLTRFISQPLVKGLIKWIAIPVAVLQVLGWLGYLTSYLDSLEVVLGHIEISAYGVVRVVLFGLVLFWVGRLSSNAGQRMIRKQAHLDVGTREVFAKLLQVGVFFVVFLLLLQVMGINLTTLAVFGGALGVGLGFGLQSIASNFISGIILLLDRSLTVGDYVELEDGQAGIIRELNMRSTTIETFDGKDVMVPNERFITGQFINWTHKNKKQRYDFTFSVAYDTDLHALFELVRRVVASHPEVLSGPGYPLEEQPDAEIQGFGDSGIEILVEFWMEAIDDGRHRVGADLKLMIWDALKEHGITIPFPQHEVRILNPGNSPTPPG
ncbi:MAG: mechanosensitive ion channel family protein [Pseudomonadota bacterium]